MSVRSSRVAPSGSSPDSTSLTQSRSRRRSLDHRLIGGDEVLLRAVEDSAHGERDHRIFLLDAAEAAPVTLHRFAVLTETVAPAGGEIACLGIPIAPVVQPEQLEDLVAIDRRIAMNRDVGARSNIAVGHFQHMEEEARRGNDAQIRHHRRHHPNVPDFRLAVRPGGAPHRCIVKAIVGVFHLERRRVVLDGEIGGILGILAAHETLIHPARTRDIAVQDADMRAVDAAFPKLKVVAVDIDADHGAVEGLRVHEAEAPERRNLLLVADVGPDDSALFAHGIARRLHALADARIGVIWRVQDRAVDSRISSRDRGSECRCSRCGREQETRRDACRVR